ncbi:MAG: urea transporter [Ignavibacteriaceae bacterium]|nr:urea transporter [Ignavibacteriaceae bacterium]
MLKFFTDAVFLSYSQIFFSNRKWFGILIFLAVMVNPLIGISSLLGILITNLLAMLLKFDSEKIRSGFYGFNGMLFGAGVMFYFEPSFYLLGLTLIFIVITFFISAVIENFFAVTLNLPGLSIPFVITTYIFFVFLGKYDFIRFANLPLYHGPVNTAEGFILNYLQALSLIVLQPSAISGIIIALALLLFSRIAFQLSLLAFAINALAVNILIPDPSPNFIIISSFNSILTALALGGALIIPSKKNLLLVVLSIFMVVIFTGFFANVMNSVALPIIVLPFNFIVLATVYSLKFRKDHTELTLLYYKLQSPEENYYYHKNRRARFDKFKISYPELPVFGEWYISQGFDGEYTHKKDWRYAWDFVVVDEKESEYSSEGNRFEDYYCYKLPVISPLDGMISKVIDGIPDNDIGDINVEKNWGNTVIINHYGGLYSALSHLEKDTIKFKEGDYIKKGDIIGQCGNSGRSPYPHLHFQFQLSEKLGEKTFQHPFVHFISKSDGGLKLHLFEYPEKGMRIQNLETHKILKGAFDFYYGRKFSFACEFKDKKFIEEWEVKIDIYNNLFLENGSGDIAYFVQAGKVLYFSAYSGNKESALYFFYLSAMQVPFCYHEDLYWEDKYSPSELPKSALYYIPEIFLLYHDLIDVNARFNFAPREEDSEDFIIEGNIRLEGKSFAKIFSEEFRSKINIGGEGEITDYEFEINNKNKFNAKQIFNDEETK